MKGSIMARKIRLKFSGFDKVINATLDDQAQVADDLWRALAKPMRMYLSHTTSTGDYFIGKGRGPFDPERVGSQAKPIGKTLLLTRLPPGSLCYAGAEEMSFTYGPDITEPLPDKGPVTARVDKGDLDNFYKAGMHVWDSQYRHHKLVTVTAARLED
jgi:hypothetical protein